MTAVLFCMAMIIEIVYVFMSPVPKELENKYLLIGIAFICAADFTYHIDYTTIKMYVFALLGTIATSIFLISCVVGVITKCIDFTDLFFTLYMALFQPLLTMVLTSSYELMIVVIIAVVGLGMSIFMVHKEKTTGRKGKSDMINEKKLKKELQKRFDAFVRKCGMADDMKSYGYASCYEDVSDIIEQLATQNDIERLSHYIYSHLCKYRPLKGLLKSVNIKVGRKLKLR